MACKWIVLRVVMNMDGVKASDVLGDDLTAEDKPSALAMARLRHPKVPPEEVFVISRLSWDMSMEEKGRMAGRKKARMGSMRGRGDGSRKD